MAASASEFSDGLLEQVEHLLIPLRDGVRLAGRMWLPRDAVQQRVPAVLEYVPYRKPNALTHPYLAGFGYRTHFTGDVFER